MRRAILTALIAASLAMGAQAQVFRSGQVAPSVVPFGARSAAPPASVLSLGPNRTFAPPPSVTSLGPNGFSNLPVVFGPRFRRHIRQGFVGSGGVFAVPVYVPYAVPVEPYTYDAPQEVVMDPSQPDSSMVVEHRPAVSYSLVPQPEASRYGTHYLDRREVNGATATTQSAQPSAAAESATPAGNEPQDQPATVLVFKDGHRLRITNYAIQGDTIFNFSGMGPRKIAVADLNVKATEKENDERGIDFRLP